jgi:hypothetical protein
MSVDHQRRKEILRLKGMLIQKIAHKFDTKLAGKALSVLRSSARSTTTRRGDFTEQNSVLVSLDRIEMEKRLSLKTIFSFIKTEMLTDMKQSFEMIRSFKRQQDFDCDILRGLVSEIETKNYSLKLCLETLTKYFKKLYPENLTCNIAFVDLITEKLFSFNKHRDVDFKLGANGKKQIKSVEKIIENGIKQVFEGVSLFNSYLFP